MSKFENNSNSIGNNPLKNLDEVSYIDLLNTLHEQLIEDTSIPKAKKNTIMAHLEKLEQLLEQYSA